MVVLIKKLKLCDLRPLHIDDNLLTVLPRYSFILSYDINTQSFVRKRILSCCGRKVLFVQEP
jgi:hypothetical protein